MRYNCSRTVGCMALMCLLFYPLDIPAYELPDSAQGIRPLLVGAVVPELILNTSEGDPFDLNKALAKKDTVLIFYRGGWCPYCNMQLSGLKEIDSALIELGYQIIAVSADRPEKSKDTAAKHGKEYIFVSDNKMAGAKAFGIAFEVDDKTIEVYKGYGIDLENASGEKHHILPVPAVFIIGKDGVIRFEYINPDYKIRLDPDVLICAAKAVLKQTPVKKKQGYFKK